jgi:hypothetical protein
MVARLTEVDALTNGIAHWSYLSGDGGAIAAALARNFARCPIEIIRS